ncbi:hypothetical protein LV779_34720 [Streptomyces thinghirensis]|nr:hypothetical protein [Streptomyces thinghirensis]
MGRSELPERLGLPVTSVASLTALLENVVAGDDTSRPPSCAAAPSGDAGDTGGAVPPGAAAEGRPGAAWVRGARVRLGCAPQGRPPAAPRPAAHARLHRDHYWIGDEPPRPPRAPPCDTGSPGRPRSPGTRCSTARVPDATLRRLQSTLTAADSFLRDTTGSRGEPVPARRRLPGSWRARPRAAPCPDASVSAGPAETVEVLRLENVVWSRPVVVGDGTQTVRYRS